MLPRRLSETFLQATLTIFVVLVQHSSSESNLESGCKGPGVFPHPADCAQFLICAEDHGKTFVAETVPCPENYSFSVPEKTCVRSEECVPVTHPPRNRVTRADGQRGCKASGPYCESCDRLVVCANLGERGLTALTNISCSEIDPDMSCSKASCTTQPTTTQPCEDSDKAGSFRCLQPGFFPDPVDCKRFHVCGSDLSHFSGECDDKFDADLGICTSVDPDNAKPPGPETGHQCKNLEKPCTEPNVSPVPLPTYPSYYVICIPVATKNRKSPYTYQLSVGKCPGRQGFNPETMACEFSCTGKRGRFQDPDNCRSYIECSGNAAVRKDCPENLAFHPDRKFCLPESMVQGCQRTRTAVDADATTTPATPTTTPATPTTTPAIPNEGFRCQASGAFPDKSDCHKFITCSRVSRGGSVYFHMRRKQCPFLTFFNPNGYCQLGFCWN